MKKTLENMRLSTWFIMLVTIVTALALLVYVFWSQQSQENAAESKALAQARVLNIEMKAIWDYINANQDRINYNADGAYDFKGVYCTIAGKAIVQNFNREVDFDIRFIRENPRNKADVPDDFELTALQVFETGADTEYYRVVEREDDSALRFVSVLRIDGNCLLCHGGPAGEIDPSGYIKEGMKMGDLAGAVSITIPMGLYNDEIQEGLRSDVLFIIFLFTLVLLLVLIAMRYWIILPIQKLKYATNDMSKGVFPDNLDDTKAKGEIKDLQGDYLAMAQQLQTVHSTLETKVADRTAALEKANSILVDQREHIARMNEDLQQMNDDLCQENEFKSNFLTIMSHELRTPLSSIIAFTDLWEKSAHAAGDEEAEYVQEIKSNSRVLLGMIDNIIDAARLEANRFDIHWEEVDLVDVVNAVEAIARPIAADKGIVLSTIVDAQVPLIVSDWEALRKIISNLVSNALKFTREKGEISVKVECGRERDSVVIEVKDSGIGIAEEDINTVFDRFVQADSSISREHGGSGLGLSLVKDLSEILGGSVSVVSVVGEGSLFTVVLPLRVEGFENEDFDS